jgi:hypothetical protein
VNWNDLKMALTTSPGEWACYLDVRTGEVRMVARYGDSDDQPATRDEIHAGLSAGHLIYIEPLGSSVEYRWMAEFAESVADARLRTPLESALEGRGGFRRFKNVLAGHPAEREEWFGFRDARVRAAAREWLAEHGIKPTTSPSPPSRPPRIG